MISNADILRAASILVDLHGSTADIHAAQLQDDKLDQGDMDGRESWRQIRVAVDELLAIKPERVLTH